eukprot:3394858-Amphidinium_carterae.3
MKTQRQWSEEAQCTPQLNEWVVGRITNLWEWTATAFRPDQQQGSYSANPSCKAILKSHRSLVWTETLAPNAP